MIVMHSQLIGRLTWDADAIAMREDIAQVDGHLRDEEGLLLYELARRCSGRGVIVEIGSFKGKSTIWLARGSRAGAGAKVYAVDPHRGSPELRPDGNEIWTFDEFQMNIARAGVADLVFPIVARSIDAVQTIAEPIELLFIDGDHAYDAVRADVATWAPRLVEDGVIALHDTNWSWPGPQLVAFQSLYGSRRFRRVGTVGSITFAERGKPGPADIAWRLKVLVFKLGVGFRDMRVFLRALRKIGTSMAARVRQRSQQGEGD